MQRANQHELRTGRHRVARHLLRDERATNRHDARSSEPDLNALAAYAEALGLSG